MKKKTQAVSESKRLVDVPGFMLYTGLGRNNAMKLGEEIGCKVKIGHPLARGARAADGDRQQDAPLPCFHNGVHQVFRQAAQGHADIRHADQQRVQVQLPFIPVVADEVTGG